MAVIISTISLIVSLCALWGAIEKTMDLQRQLDFSQSQFERLKEVCDGIVKYMRDDLDDSIQKKKPTTEKPTAPYHIYTQKVLSGEIDPKKVSLLDFYTKSEFLPLPGHPPTPRSNDTLN